LAVLRQCEPTPESPVRPLLLAGSVPVRGILLAVNDLGQLGPRFGVLTQNNPPPQAGGPSACHAPAKEMLNNSCAYLAGAAEDADQRRPRAVG